MRPGQRRQGRLRRREWRLGRRRREIAANTYQNHVNSLLDSRLDAASTADDTCMTLSNFRGIR